MYIYLLHFNPQNYSINRKYVTLSVVPISTTPSNTGMHTTVCSLHMHKSLDKKSTILFIL